MRPRGTSFITLRSRFRVSSSFFGCFLHFWRVSTSSALDIIVGNGQEVLWHFGGVCNPGSHGRPALRTKSIHGILRKRDPAGTCRQVLWMPLVETEIANGRLGARHEGGRS